MIKECHWQTLQDTKKRIDGLKGFHIPVTLKVIEEYEEAGVDGLFINQQRVHLQKLYDMLGELEAKAERLRLLILQE